MKMTRKNEVIYFLNKYYGGVVYDTAPCYWDDYDCDGNKIPHDILEKTESEFECVFVSDIPINYGLQNVYFIVKHKPTNTFYRKNGNYNSYESTIAYDEDWSCVEPKEKQVTVYE